MLFKNQSGEALELKKKICMSRTWQYEQSLQTVIYNIIFKFKFGEGNFEDECFPNTSIMSLCSDSCTELREDYRRGLSLHKTKLLFSTLQTIKRSKRLLELHQTLFSNPNTKAKQAKKKKKKKKKNCLARDWFMID